MKAMFLESQAPVESRPLKLHDMQRPKVLGHEILVKVHACGVCHTDVHIVEGEAFKSPKLPIVPGHEIAGTVEEKGDMVEGVELGDRVGMGWTYSTCMSCGRCLEGRENTCALRESTGYRKNGGYAEYVKLDSRFVSKIPANLKFEDVAPLFCGGLTAYKATKKIAPQPYENIAVVGIGGIGGYAIQFAKMLGAKVFAFSRNPIHLEMAKKLGADIVIDSSKDLLGQMKGLGMDAAMVFAPSPKVLEETLISIPRGGRVVMAGSIERTTQMDYRAAMSGEKTLMSVTTGSRKDMMELLWLAAEGKVRSSIEKVNLEEANEALIRLKKGEVEGRLVLV